MLLLNLFEGRGLFHMLILSPSSGGLKEVAVVGY